VVIGSKRNADPGSSCQVGGMGGGGEHFHETSSSNDLSRGVEDYAHQE
jgi:hypothetical protein